MVPSQWKSLVVPVVFACVLSLGVLRPGSVSGQNDKQDVCHRESNGTYHLITIAEPAYQNHLDHGDANIGDEVPDGSRLVFNEACEPVLPCGAFAPDTLPSGSYLASCESCGVSAGVLSCSCRNTFGDLFSTELDLAHCDPNLDISNREGVLTCTQC